MPFKLVCVATPITNRTKAVLLPKVNLHTYPSSAHISTEHGSKTITVGVNPETVKFLIGVILYIMCSLLLVPALSLLARVTLLLSVPTDQHAYNRGAQAAFSVFCGEGHS